MSKILDVVRGLNSIISSYKHPMYNVDERWADVHFANMDTTTTFTQDEVVKIYNTVIAACDAMHHSEDGRPQPLRVFFKCFINSEGKAMWNIYKNGMVVITVVFNTRPTTPETYNQYIAKPLPPSMEFDMLKSPVAKPVSDSDLGSWIRRIYNGSSIVLNSDMDAFRKVIKCYTDGKMIKLNVDADVDYDILMSKIPTTAKLYVDMHRNPHIEFYFRGALATEPTYVFCPFPSRGIMLNEHEMGMMMKTQFAELKEWVDDYFKPSVIDVTKY